MSEAGGERHTFSGVGTERGCGWVRLKGAVSGGAGQ